MSKPLLEIFPQAREKEVLSKRNSYRLSSKVLIYCLMSP